MATHDDLMREYGARTVQEVLASGDRAATDFVTLAEAMSVWRQGIRARQRAMLTAIVNEARAGDRDR